MAASSARVFDDQPAVRGPTPLLFGLIGPSGSGKTFSALRLATGMQRVFGGDVFMIDTESNRGLHYAERFRFRHVPFRAPFSPLDYLDAINHCVSKGAKTIIVDSTSHEHEGPGGVLEMHQREVERMSGGDYKKAERVKMLAWGKPKAERRRLINTVIQMPVNFLFCFRAKEKLKIVPGKEPEQLGFMPIAGEEFVYELAGKALLLPGANGVPTWQSNNAGERMMIKLPEQFRSIFDGSNPTQLDESIGQKLAEWAAGGAASAAPAAPTVAHYESCITLADFEALEQRRQAAWKAIPTAQKAALKAASDAAGTRLRGTAATVSTVTPGALDAKATEVQLRAATTLDALREIWADVLLAYPNAAEIPIELDAAYTDMKDALAERGE